MSTIFLVTSDTVLLPYVRNALDKFLESDIYVYKFVGFLSNFN